MSTAPQFAFTVFTPTYNRARTLHRVWESLLGQQFRDFEWLVVDDGSTDNTRELVEGYIKAAPFPVRYVWQANQHKKVAFNTAAREARGELLLYLDSDDACVPQALERFWWHWNNIPETERPGFSAVTVLCMNEDGSVVGDRFPGGDWIDATGMEIQHKWKVRGEKWGFHRTEVIRTFPFPEDVKGCLPEGYVWTQIDRHYKTRFVNEPLRIYTRDQDDSLIHAATRNPAADADGSVMALFMELAGGIRYFRHDPVMLAKKAANLVRMSLHCTLPHRQLLDLWNKQPWQSKLLLLAVAPVGVAAWMRDRWRFRGAA